MTTLAPDTTPLNEFEWSDSVIGIGFLPEEVGLPPDWSWRQVRTTRRPPARADHAGR
jgi:hypothetical protein